MDPKDMNPEELKEFITNPNNYVKVSSYTKKLEDKILEIVRPTKRGIDDL